MAPFPGFLYVDGYKVKLIKVPMVEETKTDPGKQAEKWTHSNWLTYWQMCLQLSKGRWMKTKERELQGGWATPSLPALYFQLSPRLDFLPFLMIQCSWTGNWLVRSRQQLFLNRRCTFDVQTIMWKSALQQRQKKLFFGHRWSKKIC